MNLFDLMAKITLDSSEYEKGLDDSEKKASNFGSNLKKGLGTAAKIGGAALAAVGTTAVATGAAILKGAGGVAEYGDNIDKMSQKMGISATAYQEWDAILQHSGTSIDGMQKAMLTLSNAAETGSDAFEKLGLTQEQVASMNQEELFAATITGLQNMEAGTERTALAQKLLGGAVKELGPLLNTSAEETEAMRQRVHELGGVMSDEAVKASAAYQDSLQDMSTSFDGLKRGIFAEFMPGITGVMNGLTDIFSGDPDSGVAKVNDGISDMVKKISDGLPKVLEVGGKIVTGLVQAITDNLPQIIEQGVAIIQELAMGIVKQLPQLVKSGLQIIVSLADSIAKSLPELIPTIVDIILEIVDILTDPENLEMLIEAAIKIVIALAEGIIKAIPKLLEAAVKLMEKFTEGIVKAIVNVAEAGKKIVSGFVDGVKSWFNQVKDSGKQIVDRVKDGVTGAFDAFKQSVSEKFAKIKDAITAPFESAYEWVKGVVDKLKNIFNFEWSLPKIKLPHFKVSPYGWKFGDLLKGSIPSLSIEWYKKAYDEPYLFDKPTVVGAKGFGDGNGSEFVYGRDNLMQDIREAVGSPNVTFNIYQRAGEDSMALARRIEQELIRLERQRKVGALA